VDAYQDRNRGCLPIFYVLGVPSLLAFIFSFAIDGNAIFLWLIASFVMVFWYRQWAKLSEFAAAKKTLDEMSNQQVWKEQFMRLHRRFGNAAKVRVLQKADKDMMRAFFENSNLLPD